MPRRTRSQVKALSPSVLVLVIIASVLLSAGIFYSTALIIGGGELPGGGLPGGEVPKISAPGVEICSASNCYACDTQDTCEAFDECEWRTGQAPTGSITTSLGGTSEGECYEKNVHSKTSTGIGLTDPSKPSEIEMADKTPGVDSVTIELESYDPEDLPDVSISVKRLMARPAGISAPSGTAYRYFQMTGRAIGSEGTIEYPISNVKVDFIVEQDWIVANNVDKNTLKIWRAGDSAFTAVPTTIISESATQVIVRGEASGFSYWTITGEEACSGSVSLDLPDSADGGESVTATVSGLSNCAGKTVFINAGSCAGETMCSVTVAGGGGSCGFDAPNNTDTFTYVACVDKDGDGKYTSSGEADEAEIDVTAAEEPSEPAEAECGNGICETGEDSENCPQDCPKVTAPPAITSEDALNAINNAKGAITDARKENKDVSEALSLLNDAILAYNGADYETAKEKADAALQAALKAPAGAPPVELPVTYIILAIIIIGAGAGGIFLFRRGGMARRKRAVKVPAPKR